MISVLLPVYQEEKALPALLERLGQLEGDFEVIFADGGSTDATVPLLRDAGYRVVTGAKGRGNQCNLAAAHARGDILFFLHADSAVEKDVLSHIQAAVDAGARWGCLTITFDDTRFPYCGGIRISNFRAKVGHIVFGDQGMYFTRSLFAEIGGFPDLPIMEDYELSLRLKKKRIPPVVVKSPIMASVRRFEAGGPWRVGFQMYYLRHLYRKGVSPQRLQERYRDCR